MVAEKKNSIHQTLNTILLTIVGIIAGLIYSSNIRINNKLNELTVESARTKLEITEIKNNYQSKLDAQISHQNIKDWVNNTFKSKN